MNVKQRNIFLRFSILFILLLNACIAQKRRFLKDPDFIITPSTPIVLEKELEVFNDSNTNALYRITIGADVPNNKKPLHVLYQFEPGHIFLILQKIMGTDTIHKVFGFYPPKGLPIFLKRKVKSQIKDNSKREHDVELSKMLTEEEFKTALQVSLKYSQKKYHLNKFNCYDYAIYVFNAVAGNEALPIIHVKYPLFFGRGGSPCGFYKYMKEQKESGSALATDIQFGNLVAPVSTKNKEQLLGHK